MAYINTTNGQYPVTEQEIRYQFPNTSFPMPFAPPEGFAWVFPTPKPTFDWISQNVIEAVPESLGDGNWEQRWQIIELDPEQVASNQAWKVAQIKDSIVNQTQNRLDEFARTRNYDGILSACTYATSPTPKFAAEGQYCVAARDATWATLYQIMADVEAGNRPLPENFASIAPELPVLTWPAV